MKRYRWIIPAGLLLVILSLIWVTAGKKTEQTTPADSEQVMEQKLSAKPVLRYGLPVDSFRLEEFKIQKNQMLSGILLERGISYARIDELARKSKPVFDVRRMKAGQPCTFFYRTDSMQKMAYMVYEIDLENYLVYGFKDSVEIVEGKKELVTEKRTIAGEIESSLWNALASLNVSTKLAIELSSIYAWTIDFFGIQKGDRFQILYTVKLIDDKAIGIDEILASSFYHGGRDHFAFQFEQDGQTTYFDENGQSLRRAFLKAPLNFRRISSGYSNRRLHPILRTYRPHRGIDYAADQGTPVVSIGDGKVATISYDKASGNYIKIKHNSVYTSGYLHLMEKPRGLRVGDYVKQGQEIGKVGKTGYATGPHLDFRIWMNGQLVNPLNVESPPVEPVSESNFPEFSLQKEYYLKFLSGEETLAIQ